MRQETYIFQHRHLCTYKLQGLLYAAQKEPTKL